MHELLQLRIAPIAARCTRDPWPLPLASRTLLPCPSVSSYFRILNRRTVGAITAKLLRIHCGGSVQFIGQNGLVFLLGWSQQVFESMPCLDGHVLVTTLKLAALLRSSRRSSCRARGHAWHIKTRQPCLLLCSPRRMAARKSLQKSHEAPVTSHWSTCCSPRRMDARSVVSPPSHRQSLLLCACEMPLIP